MCVCFSLVWFGLAWLGLAWFGLVGFHGSVFGRELAPVTPPGS